MATQVRSMTPDLVQKGLDKVFFSEVYKGKGRMSVYKDHEAPNIFKQAKMDSAYYVVELFKDMGLFDQTLEDENYGESNFGTSNKMTVEAIKFTKSLKISEEMLADTLFPQILQRAKNLGKSAYKTMNINAGEAYRGAFSTMLTVHGKPAVDDTNTTLNGDAADNKITDAFSEAALDKLVEILQNQLDHDGTPGDVEPTDLVIPPALYKSAKVLFESELRPGTADNDVNVYSRVVKGYDITLNVLKSIGGQVQAVAASGGKKGRTAGSDTHFFLVDRNEHTIHRFVREGLKTWVTDPSVDRAHNTYYNAKFREEVAIVDYRGIAGSDGTNL